MKKPFLLTLIFLMYNILFIPYSYAQCTDSQANIAYQAHVADSGWNEEVCEYGIVGSATSGQQMEAVIINLLSPLTESCGLRYQAHVAEKGWLDWVAMGEQAGTTEESRRMEAVKIELTQCSNIDVIYRAYVNGHWQNWVRNGSIAGTTSQSLPMEALQIKIQNPATDEICDADTCKYPLYFSRSGFYVASAQLPDSESEGFWGMTIADSSTSTFDSITSGGINIGAVLKENGDAPGYMAFNISESIGVAEKISLTPYEYSGSDAQLTVSLLKQEIDGQRSQVITPIVLASGETMYSPTLDPGFYVAEVYSQPNSPRGRFGINISAQYIAGGINLGGWLDHSTGGTGEGFVGFNLNQARIISIWQLYGQNYGTVGSGKPGLKIYYQKEDGSRLLYYPAKKLAEFGTGTIQKVSTDSQGLSTYFEPDFELNNYNLVRNSDNSNPVISDNGRYVVFVSNATNLTDQTLNNYPNVFVKDLQTQAVELISVNSDGISIPSDIYSSLAISADGRFVTFVNDISPEHYGDFQIFLRDREAQTTLEMENGYGGSSISADGNYLVFTGYWDAKFSDSPTPTSLIYLYERETGNLQAIPTEGSISYPRISGDGNWIVYKTYIPPQTDRFMLYNRITGEQKIIVDKGLGQYGVISDAPIQIYGARISANGQYVVFLSSASLVADDTNETVDVYLYNRINDTFKRLSHHADGSQTVHISNSKLDISSDGQWVSYQATQPIRPNAISLAKLYLYNVQTEQTVEIKHNKLAADNDFYFRPPFGELSLSSDGLRLAYEYDGQIYVYTRDQ
ncbi:MAG: hypothetical protein VSS52_010235 [Thiotrichaceae bacterium]|nr:hypothetical protein [Thiotrichaceae bacterium]